MIEKAMEFAREIFSGDASGHDFDHTMRVYRMATRLAKEEGADQEIVQLAALLHDVDDHKLSPETCENHLRAVTFLRENGVDEEKIRIITDIISRISFSANRGAPSTLEGKCVQDADRLDAMGAIGIARTFAYGGKMGRPIYDPLDPANSLQHFDDKLLLLADGMRTEAGKRLAQARHAVLVQFKEEFLKEWNAENIE